MSTLKNSQIPYKEIQLLIENTRTTTTLSQALSQLPLNHELDLVNKTVSPPIVKQLKIILKQKEKEKEKKPKNTLKLMEIGSGIQDNDIKIKLNKVEQFLVKGNSCQFTVIRKGSEDVNELVKKIICG